MGKIKWLHIVLLPWWLLSCNNLDTCFEPHGSEKEEIRQVNGGFHTVEIHDFVDLYLSPQGEQSDVTVVGGENLLSSIKTEIKDSVLIIKQDVSCRWTRNYDQRYGVKVNIPALKAIRYFGSGDITSTDTLKGESIQIDSWNGAGTFDLTLKANLVKLGISSGNADMKVKGETNEIFVWQQALGVMDLDQMTANYCWLDHGATGDCYLPIGINTIDARVYGVGNIYYKGNPTINLEQNDGPGRLIRLK